MNGLISDKMMQALCWTLLHSLWQGLLLAIIAALIIMITRRSSPALRYNLIIWFVYSIYRCHCRFTFMRQILVANSDQPENDLEGTSNRAGQQYLYYPWTILAYQKQVQAGLC